MAIPPVSLAALERAWFDASPKRAAGGRHALAGFSYQLALSLKAFFGQVVDKDSTATLAFDGLSDLAELQENLVYLTQIKRALNRESQRSAVAEFLENDHFLEQTYPVFRPHVCFRVIGGRRWTGLDESWDPSRLGLAGDEARRWQRIRQYKRFAGYATGASSLRPNGGAPSGLPPLIIPEHKREEYKLLHTEYDLAGGRVESPSQLLPEHKLLQEIRRFCRDAWQPTLDRVAARVLRHWMR